MTADERFAALVAEFQDRPGVTPPSGGARFGGSALKVNGSVFAMLHREQLVVQLPAARVAALVAGGDGAPFRNGRGSAMREWVIVGDDEAWSALAEEVLRTLTKSAASG